MQLDEINASVETSNQGAPPKLGFTVPDFDAPFEENELEKSQESFENLFSDGDTRNEPQTKQKKEVEQQSSQESHASEKKKSSTSNKRLAQLIHANREKEMALAQANERARLAEERVRQAEEILNQKEQENRIQYAETAKLGLEAQEQLIVDRMKTARSLGDIDSEIALQNDLIQNKTVQSSLDKLANEPIRQDKAFSDDLYNDTETYVQPLDTSNYENFVEPLEFQEPTAQTDFMERNPWFVQSPALREEALEIADIVEKQLHFNGQSDLVMSPEYFQVIENTMRERYGFSSGGQIQEQQHTQNTQQVYNQKTMPNRAAYSEGVESRGISMADQYISRNPHMNQNSGALTESQIRMARNLQIPDPRNRGQTIDPSLAIKIAGQAARFHGNQDHGSFTHGGKYSISIPN